MSALYLTPESNDLEFSGGRLRFTTSAVEVAVQKARVRFDFWRGEWFLDTSQGFPYLERVLVKGVDLALVESLFRRTLLGVPEIDSVLSLTLDLDRATRELSVDWTIKVGDEVASSDEYGPFVLKVR